MKHFLNLIPLLALCCSCSAGKENLQGALSFSFSGFNAEPVKSSGAEMPDTNSFILSVENSSGETVYKGEFCSAPDELLVHPGTYTVSAVSGEFDTPAFDMPQWGDSQLVMVSAGQNVHVELLCRQMNSGVRLRIDEQFLTEYPGSAFFIKSAEGRLMYSYSERRTAYFRPGLISLLMSTGSSDEILLTRQLDRGEVLDLNIRTSASAANGKNSISIDVDTSRVYLSDTFIIGQTGQKGDSADNAMSVSEARASAGSKSVWVGGYIVAGDLSRSNARFEGPFSSRTNLAIGPRRSTETKEQCLSVELKSGSVRDALNLVDNPDNYGMHVLLKGDIEASYFGIPGIKNISEFMLR